MKTPLLLAGVALAALLAASCDETATESARDGGARTPPAGGPSFSAGPTTQVQVICPAKVQVGDGGQCYAFGLDSLGFYSTHGASSWSSSSIGTLVVSSTGQLLGQTAGTVTVSATVSGVTGNTSVAVRTDVDPTVTIDGPPVIKPSTSCSFTAIPSGGTAPFTYTWSVTSGSASGSASGDTWTGSSAVASASFTLKVVAVDVDGRKTSATHSVFVHSMGDSCL